MALKKCKECGKEVAESATTCPHCGVSHPARASMSLGAGCLVIFVLVVLVGILAETCSPTPSSSTGVPRSTPATQRGRETRWVHGAANVRSARNVSAAVVTQLNRGASVEVDSLSSGWYRVFRAGRPIGYAAASVLKDAPIPPFEIVSWNWHSDPSFGVDGSIIWNVEVRNNTPEYVALLRVDFATYDDRNQLIESDFTYVRGLSPGATATTKSYATYFGREKTARIRIDPNQ